MSIPGTVKSKVISIADFEYIKEKGLAYDGYVKDSKGNYVYVMSIAVYLAMPNKSGLEFTIVQSFRYNAYLLSPEGVGGWIWRQEYRELFFDRTVERSQEEVTKKYGGRVSYMPEGSIVELKNPETGALEESFRVFVGRDNIGYVIDKKGSRLFTDTTHKTDKGTTIFATSDDSLDPSTLYLNYFGTTYMGPNNPLTYGKDDSFHFQPTSLIEWAAYNHDKWYSRLGAKGKADAFLNGFTLEADKQLVRDARVALRHELGQMISRKNSSTKGSIRDCTSAVGIIILFGKISDFKAVKLPLHDKPFRDLYERRLREDEERRAASRINLNHLKF